MSKRQIMVLLTGMALVCSATAFADNSLDVNGDAAIVGNFGLEVLMDGSANTAFVADITPDGETVYRASFRSNPNGLTMADNTAHNIMLARQGGGIGNIGRLSMVRKTDGTYKLGCRIKRDSGGTYFCGQFTFAPNNTLITFEYVAATGAATNDGIVRIYKGANLQFERTNIQSTFVIDTLRFGLPRADADATTNGSFYLDDFQSFRTLAP